MGGYKQSYRGVGELLRSPQMQVAMKTLAERVKAEAEATAPDYRPYGVGYKQSFEVSSGVRVRGKSRRAYGRVTNTSPHAMWVEFGGRNTPKHRTLFKALHILSE